MIKVRSLHRKPYIHTDDEKRSMSMTVAWSRINRGSSIWCFSSCGVVVSLRPHDLLPQDTLMSMHCHHESPISLSCAVRVYFSSRLLALMRSQKLLRSTQEDLPVTSLESSIYHLPPSDLFRRKAVTSGSYARLSRDLDDDS